jgi:D-glycero-D-manno-heptose 1,7-bisphosphate phosphatase
MVHRRAVFLDRDGVLNRAEVRDGRPYPPRRVEDLEILPGVPEACALLRDHGFLLIVATNQPDVGRGAQSRDEVEAMHERLWRELRLDRIEVCYAAGYTPCADRKPAPGMLLRAAQECGVDLKESYMVGDRWRDIDCGAAAGCTTVLIDYHYDEVLHAQPSCRVHSLLQAAKWIVDRSKPQREANPT